MEFHHIATVTGGAFGKHRDHLAGFEVRAQGMVDAPRVGTLATLDEYRARLAHQAPQDRPGRQFCLGDKACRSDRLHHVDIQPRDVIADVQALGRVQVETWRRFNHLAQRKNLQYPAPPGA